ncbi:MAG: glycosyltransferase family 2 protein [bacterium]|nr:glycosyltransferase family 2 protein [bacterium]
MGKQGDTKAVFVLIPALNEEASIGSVIDDIPGDIVEEVVIISNGSTDRTVETARAHGATVLTETTPGYGHALMKGISYIAPKNPGILVFLDGDYSDHPDEIPLVIRPILEEGMDMVIGSRVSGEREKGALLPQARFGNWLSTTLIRLFWRYRFTDLGPFRAIRYDKFQALQMKELTYGWTVEMQIKAAKMKYKCTEVPVSYRKRIGQSKVTGTISGSVKAGIGILRTIFGSLFDRSPRNTRKTRNKKKKKKK